MPSSDVSVLVPYVRTDEYREAAWRYVQRQYDDYEVLTGTCPGPFVKAVAVADALSKAHGDVLVVADADCLCGGVGTAVDAVRGGEPWAIPHSKVLRLTKGATERAIRGARRKLACERLPYEGVPGGGIVVLPRATYESVPLDRRFVGWGGEDFAWGRALLTIYGRPTRGTADLLHLWHPRAPREVSYRNAGSEASEALRRRYIDATGDPARMTALLEEADDHRQPPHPDLHDHVSHSA